MKRPEVKDFDCKPYGYIYAMTIYVETIEKQRDELIEFSEKILKFGIIKYPYYEQLHELITKTKHNE